MNNIKQVCSNGFNIDKLERNLSNFAFVSLRTALKAYFSTYRSINTDFIMFINAKSSLELQEQFEYIYSTEYISQYAEAIVHFQHFIELVCKEILRNERENVSSTDSEDINRINFSRILDRLCDLFKQGKSDSKYSFIAKKTNECTLRELNKLRNSIWHQGTFILHYKELDIFIGKYLLPIIIQITNLPDHKKIINSWKYKPLHTEIDPINEIANECSEENFDFGKIAFLKELGRAAYENPLPSHRSFSVKITKRAQKLAKSEVGNPFLHDHCISKCPVCGVDSLVTYEDSWEDVNEDGICNSISTYSWRIKCYNCSFELYSGGLKNPKEYNYNLPDYWY
ncbi:hypothetical protein COL82_29870 [Bacillus toyonensis]|uniref:hypothetical protein n=1 Tax=Bacillus toyonensis TaxID=155322 RepID=UPI000BF714B5|nr:hypothetical protein [Bacillus toyonensis]PFZ70594.1 hypothetical protein COL82_29870 [Bacillus toyonensis]